MTDSEELEESEELTNFRKLIVVRESKPDRVVAALILKHLREENFKATIPELADKINVSEEQIINVLDSYAVVDGSPRWVGAGRGSDWLSEEQRREIYNQ